MTHSQIIPVSSGLIGNVACLTINGRTLHTTLGVRRDFSNWIKGRISKYGFVEGQDFEKSSTISSSPDLANKSHNGFKDAIEYTLTLDMGKELCMVENNEAGKIARRYFIECERKAMATRPQPLPLPTYATATQRKPLDKLVKVWATLVGGDGGVYSRLWTQVDSHLGITTIEQATPEQIKLAVTFVQGRIDALQLKTEQPLALPATNTADAKLEDYLRRCKEVRQSFDNLRGEVNKVLSPYLENLGYSKQSFAGGFRLFLDRQSVGISADMRQYEDLLEATVDGLKVLQ